MQLHLSKVNWIVRNSDKNLFLYNKYTHSCQVLHLSIELKKYELVSFVTYTLQFKAYWQCDLLYFAVIYCTELTGIKVHIIIKSNLQYDTSWWSNIWHGMRSFTDISFIIALIIISNSEQRMLAYSVYGLFLVIVSSWDTCFR